MNDRDERQAAEALATIRAHQERTERAARVPWWVYPAMFVLITAVTGANDFVGRGGVQVIAILVLAVLTLVLVTTFTGRSAPLSRLRGVQGRQTFVPWVFAVVAVTGGLGVWLLSHTDVTGDVARAAGLRHYPDTAAGVCYAAAFTALFALGRVLLTVAQRRTSR